MKQTRKQIAETAKCIDSSESSVKTFRAQLDFYSKKIRRGEELLPQLIKSIEEIENGLPVWRDKVRIYELSLKTHRDRLLDQIERLKLLKEKGKLLEKLKKLEKVK